MARLNIIPDYVIPGVVGLAELGLKAWDRSRLMKDANAMEFEPLAPYAIAVLGTGSRVFDILPRQDENVKMAVAASMPRVITGVYDWATSAVSRGHSRTRRTRVLQVRDQLNDTPRNQGGYRSF